MPGSLNTPVAGLAGHMIGFLLLVVLVNVPAVWLKLEFDFRPEPGVWLQPPGWVVVAAWWILFPAMGAARWLVVSSPRPGSAAVGWMIVGLGVLCASYAYYTLGLERLTGISSAVFGLAGNLVVIGTALLGARAAWAHSTTAAALLCGVAAWTAFASISVAQIVFRAPAST